MKSMMRTVEDTIDSGGKESFLIMPNDSIDRSASENVKFSGSNRPAPRTSLQSNIGRSISKVNLKSSFSSSNEVLHEPPAPIVKSQRFQR